MHYLVSGSRLYRLSDHIAFDNRTWNLSKFASVNATHRNIMILVMPTSDMTMQHFCACPKPLIHTHTVIILQFQIKSIFFEMSKMYKKFNKCKWTPLIFLHQYKAWDSSRAWSKVIHYSRACVIMICLMSGEARLCSTPDRSTDSSFIWLLHTPPPFFMASIVHRLVVKSSTAYRYFW